MQAVLLEPEAQSVPLGQREHAGQVGQTVVEAEVWAEKRPSG